VKDLLEYELNNKDPENRKRFIKNMFDSIVPSYDKLNHILSFGIDRLWRKRIFKVIYPVSDSWAIDLCCGTGDLSLLLTKNGAKTVSLDFSIEMLKRGRQKKSITGYCIAADACRIPFSDNTFRTATIAFGIRNIPDLDNFIKEVHRVLVPGGELVILEFSRPSGKIVKILYTVYLGIILPLIGAVISGKYYAYRYLAKTIKTFVDPVDLQKMIEKYGFPNINIYPQTFGSAAITVCRKKPE
jgi:demethylmenaquinone methyltransferase / 2-methoxy-6-polyprenyl-1,4-benzoquinol methylase